MPLLVFVWGGCKYVKKREKKRMVGENEGEITSFKKKGGRDVFT